MISIDIAKDIESIKNDFVNGSSTIMNNALDVLENAAVKYQKDKEDLVLIIAEELIKAKPEMAAVKNILNYAINQIKNGSDPETEFKIIRQNINTAKEDTLNNALELFKVHDHKIIATASYSSSVLNFLLELNKLKYIEAIMPESNFNGRYYGRKLADELIKKNVKAEVLGDDNIDKITGLADVAITGADAYNNYKGAVNGYPSLGLAKSSKNKIPFYIIAESYKISEKLHSSKGFQIIPQQLITEIISDNIFNDDKN